MKKPVLVIMAAGMGSRYGGLKQLDPVDDQGHLLIDFSIYDAKKAGFEKVVFIIKQDFAEAFKQLIGNRIATRIEVAYAYQELAALPKGYRIPTGRTKPWGTAHALLCCRDIVHGPFAVINADDFYGAESFRLIFEYLLTQQDCGRYRYAMVGYRLANTVTAHGYVSRGVCQINDTQELLDICERVQIESHEDGIAFTEDNGDSWEAVPDDTIVSMNLWGFGESILAEISNRFPRFLDEELPKDPLKCEYFLPTVVSQLIEEGQVMVKVLQTDVKWYGVTYKEDKEMVANALKEMKDQGIYPRELWRI